MTDEGTKSDCVTDEETESDRVTKSGDTVNAG